MNFVQNVFLYTTMDYISIGKVMEFPKHGDFHYVGFWNYAMFYPLLFLNNLSA